MKFTRTLASVAAAAVAVSSLAVSAFAGSITFSDSAWWTQKEVAIADILDGNDPEDVASITFTSDTTFIIGYNSTEVTDEKTGSTWKQPSASDNITISDAVLVSTEINGKTVDPALNICLSKGDGVDYTINWTVNLKDDASTPVDPADPVDPAEPDKPSDVAPGTSEDVEETVDVTIKNAGKTVIDSGLVRTNIINAWAGDDACVIADKADFANAVKVKVKFTVSDFTTPFKAWLSFANNDWSVQYWGDGNDGNLNAKGTTVEVTGNGTYEVELNFDNKIAAAEFIAVCTDLAAAEGDAIPTIAIDSVKTVVDNTPATPDEPSDPTTPDEPAKPGDTTDPTEPGDSTDPVKPDDKTDPVKPDDKTDPVKPGDSTDPVKPGDSTDPAKPGDSTKPGDDNKKPSDDNKKPSNANTGVAVAVVPAAIAAAAVAAAGIVLKKRK